MDPLSESSGAETLQLGAERDLVRPHHRAEAPDALGHGEARPRVEPLHVGEPVGRLGALRDLVDQRQASVGLGLHRSEEHTSELQSRLHLVCRLLLEKKKKSTTTRSTGSPTTDIASGVAIMPAIP